jgi:hypothetical protein
MMICGESMKRSYLLLSVILILLAGCQTRAEPPTATPRPAAVADTAEPPATQVPPTPTIEPIPVDSETLELLQSIQVPNTDYYDLAVRLAGVTQDIPRTLDPPASFRTAGERDRFWVSNQEDEYFQISATLHYVTDHAYFWVHDEAQFDQAELEALANRFENSIYPTTRSFFGSEFNPGIDGDPHIYVLYARGLGINIAGYFSTVDSLHPLVRENSNAHEMFVFNADNVDLGTESTRGTLAHEFQHMIMWNHDRIETTWMSEGLAELSQHINRLGTAEFHPFYTDDPVVSLNGWDGDNNLPHYGAGSLFVYYFYERFGSDLTKQLALNPGVGLEGVDMVLSESSGGEGEAVTANSAVLDWVIANYLNDPDVGDGRYGYQQFADFRPARQTVTLVDCEPEPEERQLNQYAPHYIRMICPGQRTLSFDGAVEVPLLPVDPYSGEYSFWSNAGDWYNPRLTRSFDFTDVSGPITLSFQTWYDIERDYDYVYLLASRDGTTWEILQTPSGTDRNPTRSSYGWGYTSSTRGGEWIEEQVDLSEYAGSEMLLRFEYVTDAGLNETGMLIDDVAIEAVDYFSDFEADEGGWEAEGWVRVKNVLPQTFRLAWISFGPDSTTVEYIPIGVNNTALIEMELPEDGEARVLVVLPTTRFTRQPASYTVSFSE